MAAIGKSLAEGLLPGDCRVIGEEGRKGEKGQGEGRQGEGRMGDWARGEKGGGN